MCLRCVMLNFYLFRLYDICSAIYLVPNTILLTRVGPRIFCRPSLSCIINLVSGVLLKLKLPFNEICDKSFGFDLAGTKRFNVTWDFLRRHQNRCM